MRHILNLLAAVSRSRRSLLYTSWIALLGAASLGWARGATPVEEAEVLLQSHQNAAAALKLDEAALKAAPEPAYARYLRALARHRAKLQEIAIADCDAVPQDSAWATKARFLKAQCLIDLHRHQEADALYHAEAERLFSVTRKEKLAEMLTDYAAELLKATGPEGQPIYANQNLAEQLYLKALDAGAGPRLREDIAFRRIQLLHDLSRTPLLDQACDAYLLEFDPQWTQNEMIERHRSAKANFQAVPQARLFEVRFWHAENLLAWRGPGSARAAARRLLALLQPQPPTKPIMTGDQGEVEWLILRSYDPSAPGQHGVENLHLTGNNPLMGNVPVVSTSQTQAMPADNGWRITNVPEIYLEKLQAFLTKYPDHPRATEAGRLRAVTLVKMGKTEAALAAYQDFLKRPQWPLPAPDSARADRRPPADRLQDWLQEAAYAIGALEFTLRRYPEAIAQWKNYSAAHPNGPLWQRAQAAMVDAEFQLGLDAAATGDEATARQRMGDFLTQHTLDPRAPQILFLLGQISFSSAEEKASHHAPAAEVRVLQERAVGEWANLISKYPQSNEATLAHYRSGLLQTGPLEEYEKGLTNLRACSGQWLKPAQARVAEVTAKSLGLSTTRIFLNAEQPTVHVKTRNIEKLRISVFRLQMQDFFRGRHRLDGANGIESLDVDLIQPDRSWEAPVAGFAKFKALEQDIEIPWDNGPGVRLVRVEGEDWQASTVVVRSDIDVVVESAWKEGLVWVQNVVTHLPMANADVLISNGRELIGQGRAGADGIFRLKGPEIQKAADLCVYVHTADGEAMQRLSLRGMTHQIMGDYEEDDMGLSRRGYVYTDRSTYHPGDTVSYRMIVRDEKDGAYVIPEGRSYRVRVVTRSGRHVLEAHQKLNAYGEIEGTAPIPTDAPTGEYVVVAKAEDDEEVHHGVFRVTAAEPQRLSMSLELQPEVVFRGDTIHGTARLRHAWGDPAADQALSIALPSGAVHQGRTDANGIYAFDFDTSDYRPGETLAFQAIDTRSQEKVTAAVTLPISGVVLQWEHQPTHVIASEATRVRVKCLSAQGRPMSARVKWIVERKATNSGAALLQSMPGLAFQWPKETNSPVMESELQTDAQTGIGEALVTLNESGAHTIRWEAVDTRGNVTNLTGTLYCSAAEDSTKLHLVADQYKIQEGGKISVSAHSRQAAPQALVTLAGEEILEYRLISLVAGHNPLEFQPGASAWPRCDVTVAFVDGRNFHYARQSFTVHRELKITIEPPANAQPGKEAQVMLAAVDNLGRPVQAQLSLALAGEDFSVGHPALKESIVDFFSRGSRVGSSYRATHSSDFVFKATAHLPGTACVGNAPLALDSEERSQALPGVDLTALPTVFSLHGLDHYQLSPAVSRTEALNALVGEEQVATVSAHATNGDTSGLWYPTRATEPSLLTVQTDAQGHAVAKLTLPSQPGAWRLMVKGCSKDGFLFGEAQKTLESHEAALLALSPRFPEVLQEGDAWTPTVALNAVDGSEQDVTVTLETSFTSGKALSQSRSARLKRGGQTSFVYFGSVTPPHGVSLVSCHLTALAHGVSQEWTQAIHVNAAPLARSVRNGGTIDAGSIFNLEAPKGPAAAPDRQLSVAYYPDADHLLAEWAQREMESPQALLALTGALRLHKAVHGDMTVQKALEERIRRTIVRLQVTQRDGGWRWEGVDWQNDSVVTSLALWGLREALAQGFLVNESTINNAVEYLKTALAVIPPTEQEKATVILFALAASEQADFAVANRLYRERNSLNDTALVFLAGALEHMRREDESGTILNLLAKKGEADPGPVSAMHWHGSSAVARLSQDADISAMALWALAKRNPQAPECGAAMQGLLKRCGADLASESRFPGLWVNALSQYFLSHQETPRAADLRVELLINGKSLHQGNGNQVARWEIASADLGAGSSQMKLSVSDPQAHPLLLATLRDPMSALPLFADLPKVTHRAYLHDVMEQQNLVLTNPSTSPVSHATYGQVIRAELTFENPAKDYTSYMLLEEPLPAGCILLENSVQGNFVKMRVQDSLLRLWFKPGTIETVNYRLVAHVPGQWRIPATRVRDDCRPDRIQLGQEAALSILTPGAAGQDLYVMNAPERLELAQHLFNKGRWDEALPHLETLRGDAEDRKKYEAEITRMLFWIYSAKDALDAPKVVELFETLSERHAELVIPFAKIRRVAEAYQKIGEFERAWLVEQATMESNFLRDASLSVALRDAGDSLGAADLEMALWEEYPDVQDVRLAYFTLAQDLQDKASSPGLFAVRPGKPKPTRIQLLERSRDMLRRFVVLYADDSQAQDAAFNLANVYFDLKDYAKVAGSSEIAAKADPKGQYFANFQYMAALGHFWQYEFPKALEAAAPVAAGNSTNANNARYITAQIYQAQGHPADAITWYTKVRDEFHDASQAIQYLEEKRIKLPTEVSFRPGSPVKVELSTRNLKEAALRIYKVDLLKLFEHRTQLDDVAKINLAGITPEIELALPLGDGKDYEWKHRMVDLPLKTEGAYLVICRGDDLFTSGLVLVTPLELQTREDSDSGDVRVNVKDAVGGGYVADADILVLDSEGASPVSGHTDPRGVFQASDQTGLTTVIVRHGSHYAFSHSTTPVRPVLYAQRAGGRQIQQRGAMPSAVQRGGEAMPKPMAEKAKSMDKDAFLYNVKQELMGNQSANKATWEGKVMKSGSGVKASEAFKKK